MLIVALDTNFKLKNRLRANAKYDPPLGSGWEYFVEPKAYREHLRKYVPEKDVRVMSSSYDNCPLLTMIHTDQHLHCLRSVTSKGYSVHGRFTSDGSRWLCVRPARVCETEWDW
jgi:hypothetical protein